MSLSLFLRQKLYAYAVQESQRRLAEAARFDWSQQARPNQKVPSGEWRIWLILAGRGFGKTRTGAEIVRLWVTQGQARRICLLGDTFQDVRKIMIEDNSGLLSAFPPTLRPLISLKRVIEEKVRRT